MNRKKFQALARIRLKEAKALYKAECYDGAYYLAGYVIEFALKACIAKKTAKHDFPPSAEKVKGIYQHKASLLVSAADLSVDLKQQQAADSAFGNHWLEVVSWSEASRYETKSQSDANRLLKAISDSKHGVFRWIRRFW